MNEINEELINKNVWGLSKQDIEAIEEDGFFETDGHWIFNKVKGASVGEYEAVYDGNYMHVFKTLRDLLMRANEAAYYEYNPEKSEEKSEEVFTNSEGEERNYN